MWKIYMEETVVSYCLGVLSVLEYALDRLHPIAFLILSGGSIALSSLFLPFWAKVMTVLLFWMPGMVGIAMVLLAYWSIRTGGVHEE